jgi:hypothetical protein
MSAFDLLHDHIARTLASTQRQPAVAQATPLATGEDIREAIEVLEVEVLEVEAGAHVGAQASLIRADQLRRVVTLLRANLHRVGG